MDARPDRRRPWIATLLALLCNGLGHVYAGRTPAGVGINALWLVATTALMFAMRLGIGAAGIAAAVAFVLWGMQAALAARAVRTVGDTRRTWLSRPLGLFSFYVATMLAWIAVYSVLEPHTVRTFAQASRSMMPTVQEGDWFVVSRGVSIERGTVVVHSAPPSAPVRDPLVKRVVAIGGDTVEVRDGRLVLNGEPAERRRLPGPCTYQSGTAGKGWHEEPCDEFVESIAGQTIHTYCTPNLPCGDVPSQKVPAGQVFVLGDFRDHSADSRVYGPIPEGAVVGRASYIYFSIGPSGVRWDRIGRAVR